MPKWIFQKISGDQQGVSLLDEALQKICKKLKFHDDFMRIEMELDYFELLPEGQYWLSYSKVMS